MKLVWFKQPCGVGKHDEIIGSELATCIVCGSVRKIVWYKSADKKWSVK